MSKTLYLQGKCLITDSQSLFYIHTDVRKIKTKDVFEYPEKNAFETYLVLVHKDFAALPFFEIWV